MASDRRAWRWQRIVAVMRLETLHLLRDRPTLGLIALVPAVQILLFGNAVNLNPGGLRLAISHSEYIDPGLATRAAESTGYFATISQAAGLGAARAAVLHGNADLGLELEEDRPPGLSADAADAATVRPAVLALSVALQREGARKLAHALNLPSVDSVARQFTPRIEWLFNDTASTAWSITPGLVGVVMMISMLLLGALTLVREREHGHWESLLATAADGTDVLLGKLSPYAALGVMQAAIVVACAHGFFGVPVRGSLLALFAGSLVFSLAHLMLGFALSALAVTQLQAIQSAVFFYLPSMLLSGFMFPFQGMPRWAQWLGELLPLTHFVRAARDVMLRGAGFGVVAADLWPVAVFAALAASVALLAYRRHLQ